MAYWVQLSTPQRADFSLQVIPTFSDSLFDRFVDYTDRKPTTVKGYLTCLKQFGKWLELNDISQPEREHIQAYRDHLAACGLSAGTQCQYIQAVKHFFHWTAAEGIYPNIADNIHGAKVRHDVHKKDPLEREDVARIAGTIDRSTEAGKRLYAIYLLCIVCGLRTIEIHRADVADIKTVGGSPFLYVQGKGRDDKDAPVLLIEEVHAALQDYLQTREAKPTPKSPLFTSTSRRNKGGRIASTTISTMLKEMMVTAGYDSDRLTAHSLRHTSGTGAHKAGIDLFGVQHLMRHSDPATSEIYIHEDNHKTAEEKGRRAIYAYYFGEAEINQILPELEAEIMTMTTDQQKELLAQIKARKGN